jgi:hypothetical protein
MANNVSPNSAPDNHRGVIEVTVAGVVDITGPVIGRSIFDNLRRKLSVSSQMREGDFLMDRSRDLLRRHIQLFEIRQQDAIRENVDDVRKTKNGLENFSGSRFQRLLEARKYRRLSKETYRIVKNASDKAIEDIIMNRSRPGGGSGPGGGPGTCSVASGNPFTDSHEVSTLIDAVNDLDRVEMSTYHAENTDGAAVVLDLVAQDQSVQHVVATFSTESFSGDTSDKEASQSIASEAPAVLSLHRDDGTVPHLIAASQLPNFSRDRWENAEVESRTVASMAISEPCGTSLEGSVFYPESHPC